MSPDKQLVKHASLWQFFMDKVKQNDDCGADQCY